MMDNEAIARLGFEAGAESVGFFTLKKFAELVAAHEREAIAADADWCIQNNLEQFIPERIRARST